LTERAASPTTSTSSTCSRWNQIERRQIERVIRQHHGNKTRAAKALGIDRRTLYRKLERYDGAPRLPTLPLNGSAEA
jgi:two-component system, NtrC family, response regulator AtoC